MTQSLGWRYIFFASILAALFGLVLMRGVPESRAASKDSYRFDFAGVISFMIAMVALQVVVTQGTSSAGPVQPRCLMAVTPWWLAAVFVRIEEGTSAAFVHFSLFSNATYTGATVSNFLLNAVAGTMIVSLQLVELGGNMTAQQAGVLTLGYAVAIIAFIRVGEKLLQRFGARKPMVWGCLITGLGILFLSLVKNLLLKDYKILAIIGYTLYGVGPAFYATPSTDAALSSLPENQAGAGAGIYNMASSLGAALGVAISATIFAILSSDTGSRPWMEGVITFYGRQDNQTVRAAAMIALMFNVFMVAVALLSIMLTIPQPKRAQGRLSSEAH